MEPSDFYSIVASARKKESLPVRIQSFISEMAFLSQISLHEVPLVSPDASLFLAMYKNAASSQESFLSKHEERDNPIL